MPDPQGEPDPDGRPRVLVVDADDRVRESLAALLAIGDQVVIVGTTGQPATALTMAVAARPDVVILDPRLPDVGAGVALIAGLRDLVPGVRILAMSRADGPDHAEIDCGADGCVRKTFRPAELLAAVLSAGRPSAASRGATSLGRSLC